MKKVIILLLIFSFAISAAAIAELTPEQRAEQRRQLEAAQRAYEASANTYEETSTQAGIYKEGFEIIRDTVQETAETVVRYT